MFSFPRLSFLTLEMILRRIRDSFTPPWLLWNAQTNSWIFPAQLGFLILLFLQIVLLQDLVVAPNQKATTLLRRSTHTTSPLIWLQDYVLPNSRHHFSINNVVGYNNLSAAYQAFVGHIILQSQIHIGWLPWKMKYKLWRIMAHGFCADWRKGICQ